jgi:hypothetical protein
MPEPVEYQELSRGNQLQPQFALLGNFRFFEPDSGQPVICQVKPEGAPSPETASDMVGAMNAWSNVSGCALVVQSGGLLSACYTSTSLQGIGIVFDNCDGRNSPSPGCASTLAWGGIRLTAPETKVINGTTFRRTTQGFVSFNPYASCHFTSRCNVQEVATHEVGHALGLNHSQDSSATMAAFAHFDGRCASIRQDDADGIRFIYPGSGGGGGGGLAIATSSLASGTVGTFYSQTLTASGGTAPYTWNFAPGSGPLPGGLSLGSNGAITGTPSAAGTFNFTVQVRDVAQATAQKALSIVVSSSGQQYDSTFVLPQTVPTTLVTGQSFNATVSWRNSGAATWLGSNGFQLRSQNPANNTTWGGNVIQFSQANIPPGETVTITFTAFAPSTPGTYNFQWQTYQIGVGFFGEPSQNVSITVSSPTSSPTVTSPSPLAATQGSAFTHQLTASGGTSPYTWSIVGGSLPQGLSLSNGVISGTPAAAGNSTFTIQASDTQSRTGQKAITINVSPPALSITTSSLANAMRGLSYSQQLNASGGTPPYNWSVMNGLLPGGLGITNGTINGVPTVSGQFQFTLQVTDAASRAAQKSFNLTVAAPSALTLELAQRMDAMKGSAFTYNPAANGGVAPYTWSITSGSLPAGLALNPATGAITGTPGVSGTFNVGLTVRDQTGQSASGSIEIKVIDPATLPVIRSAKYKRGKKKLTIKGDRFDPAAALMIDGVLFPVKFNEGSLVAKKLVLAQGRHELKVVNPGNAASQVFVLNVN